MEGNELCEGINIDKYQHVKGLKVSDFGLWLSNEYKYWEDLRSIADRSSKNGQNIVHPEIFTEINEYVAVLYKIAPENSKKKNIFEASSDKSDFDLFREANIKSALPMHDDPQAKEFKLAFVSGYVIPALYSFRLVSNNSDRYWLRGYHEGVHVNVEALTKKLSTSVDHINEMSAHADENIATQVSSANEKISRLVEAATSAIALSEPVKFWEDRRSIHKVDAKKYSRFAMISALLFGFLLLTSVLYEYYSGVPHEFFGYTFTLPKTLSGIATILLISMAGIWSTRIFVKLMMANLTMEIESIERSTMIKTFVAMQAAESKISDESQLLFYTTLFRPSNNVISEESTAPEFGRLFEAILKSRSGEKPSAN
ncbi:DUF6161 domain-containing protein [Pseudomonas fluorescens]|uniref:DUF6161 domain-containing protein n=1 Tax=Pseudomonas fluorescens TaxID=294 RepID=UPI002B1E7034|nr:DUF6161 domain-containing protein [Pseudomonas fluorescens]